jgi:site-specific recombinase XerD
MRKNITQLFDEFVFECIYVRKLRKATIQGYKQSFATFSKLMPGISLETLNVSSITIFLKTLEERERNAGKGIIKTGVRKSTVAAYWSKLNAFFSWLSQREHIKTNPFEGMQRPSPTYDDKKFLEKKDIEKILAAIHKNNKILVFKRNLVLFYLLLFCGLRREEVMHVQLRDIDLDNNILTVRAETSKSGKSRQLPLHSTVVMQLKDYLKERREYTTQYLFISANRDAKLSYHGLIHLVDKLQALSGVKFHLHQFRHTFAVNFLKTNKDLFALKQLLGHADIKMTVQYLRCLPVDRFRQGVESMSIDRFI